MSISQKARKTDERINIFLFYQKLFDNAQLTKEESAAIKGVMWQSNQGWASPDDLYQAGS